LVLPVCVFWIFAVLSMVAVAALGEWVGVDWLRWAWAGVLRIIYVAVRFLGARRG
jgi:hypothetical protein